MNPSDSSGQGTPVQDSTLPQTSLSVLERAKDVEDSKAWDILVELYLPFVYRWCLREQLQEHDAADITQDVFRILLEKLHRFDKRRPEDSFRKWLKTITLNCIRDFFRAHQRIPQTGVQEVEVHAGASVNNRLGKAPDLQEEGQTELKQLCQAAIRVIQTRVKTHNWEAFRLVVIEGHSPQQVADWLHVQLNAVHLACSRLKQTFRDHFEGLIEELGTNCEPGSL